MVKINPWPLTRSNFVITWLDLSNRTIKGLLSRSESIKGSGIGRIYSVKIHFDLGTGEHMLYGRYEGDCLGEFMSFCEDSYITSWNAKKLTFAVIDEHLQLNRLNPLSPSITLDTHDVLQWIEDKKWLNSITKKFDIMDDENVSGEEKLKRLRDVFIEEIFPILKNGIE